MERDLYFRGTNNSIKKFEYPSLTLGIYSADKVVITGISLDGITTYQ
jgi:hypothetical protein